jgi:hypothetical protein
MKYVFVNFFFYKRITAVIRISEEGWRTWNHDINNHSWTSLCQKVRETSDNMKSNGIILSQIEHPRDLATISFMRFWISLHLLLTKNQPNKSLFKDFSIILSSFVEWIFFLIQSSFRLFDSLEKTSTTKCHLRKNHSQLWSEILQCETWQWCFHEEETKKKLFLSISHFLPKKAITNKTSQQSFFFIVKLSVIDIFFEALNALNIMKNDK